MKTSKSISFTLAAMLGISALSPITSSLAAEDSDPITPTFFHYGPMPFKKYSISSKQKKESKSFRKVPALRFILKHSSRN